MLKKISIFIVSILISFPAIASVDVYFSPHDDLESKWVEVIDSARESIKVSCFGLTNDRIYQALVDKRKTGIPVLVCIDKMQSSSRHDKKPQMIENDIEVVTKKTIVLEHNKMIVVDGKDAIIGSYNLSDNAQNQDNSIAFFKDEPEIAQKVTAAIERIKERDL